MGNARKKQEGGCSGLPWQGKSLAAVIPSPMLFLRVCHRHRAGTGDEFQPWIYEVLQVEGLGEERPLLAGPGWSE